MGKKSTCPKKKTECDLNQCEYADKCKVIIEEKKRKQRIKKIRKEIRKLNNEKL